MQCRDVSRFRRFAVSAAMLVTLPMLWSCSKEVSQGATEPLSSSVFPTLTDPTGCVIEQITNADHDEYQVQGASPDGKTLFMAGSMAGPAENETVYEAYEVDLSTGEKKDLSHVLQNSGPYSPDGKFNVVAQSTENGKTDIFEYERATGKLRPVASHEDWDWLPSYSPDGRYILFNSYRVGGQSDIHLFEKSTGELRRLTDAPEYEAHGQFSPDGKRIIYHHQRGTREDGGYVFDLMVYDMDTEKITQLTDTGFEEGYPAWAPDGRHVVYSSDADSTPKKPNLYILSPEGELIARLTQGDWKDSYAFWTRDGKYIYFNSDRSGVTNIYRMLMDGMSCMGSDINS